MKNGLWFLSLLVATFMFNACDKEDDDNNSDNWAAAVAGTYTGTADYCSAGTMPAVTIITRISDKMLHLQVSFNGDSHCLDSVSMNSSTTIIINERDGCYSNATTGNGNFSGNNVNYTINYTGTGCSIPINGSK